MSINGATPIVGGTYAAPTSGSADALSAFGSLTEMKALFDADTPGVSAKSMSFTVTEPKPLASAPNGYTQAKRQAYLRVPLVLDNGNITTCSVRIEISFDSEMTSSEIEEMCLLGSQVLGDADFSSWRVSGILE
jgi:hypothetical protein